MTVDHAETDQHVGIWARTTAPQSEFSTRDVGIGFVVLAIGLSIAFGLPLLLV